MTTVAIEGLDGAGKSVQARELARRLAERGASVRVMRLYDTPRLRAQFDRLNRGNLIGAAEASCMTAAELAGRLDMLDAMPRPAEEVVIWDKYVAGGRARDLARGVGGARVDALYGALDPADVTLFLSLAPEQALVRKRAAGAPNLWESGLDIALGMEVREIERKLRDGAIEAAMIDRCFVSFQRAVFDRYGTTLPPDTIGIDAGEPVAAVAERAFEAVLARSVHEAS